MGNLVKSNPDRMVRDVTIGKDRLEKGLTYRELAEKHGVSLMTISRALNNDEIKDIIEEGTKQALSLIPKAMDNYREFLSDEDKKIRLAATQDISKISGITPSHNTNNMIVQINTGNRPDLAPEVIKLLQIHNDQDDDIIDVDLELDNG